MNAKASQTLDAPGTLRYVIVRRIERRKIVDNQTDSEDFVSRMGQIASCFQDLSTILSLSDCMVNDFAMQQQEERERALIELLNEKGLLTIEELDKRKKQVAERLIRRFTETGIGLMYQEPEYDKYTFKHEAQVDCQDKLHVCKPYAVKFPLLCPGRTLRRGLSAGILDVPI